MIALDRFPVRSAPTLLSALALAVGAASTSAQFDAYSWTLVTEGMVSGNNHVQGDLMHVEVPKAGWDWSDARFETSAPAMGTFGFDLSAWHNGLDPGGPYSYRNGEKLTLCTYNCTLSATLDVEAGDTFGFGTRTLDTDDPSLAEFTNLVFATKPVVSSVSAGYAWAPGSIFILGAGFDASTTVFLDGVAEPIVSWSPTSLEIQPAPRDPGFADLRVVNGGIAVLELPDAVPFRPTLELTDATVGGSLSIELENGADGVWVLLWSPGTLPAPLPLGPPIYYGLLLDPVGLGVVLGGAAPGTGSVPLTFPLLNNPLLTGVELHLQAWTQQGLDPLTATWSLTDLASRILSYGTTSLEAHVLDSVAGPGFGSTLARVGDVSGDGIEDLLIGDPHYPTSGKAYVWSVATATTALEVPSPGGGIFGKSVDGIGDVDGDGRADLLVGAFHYSGNGTGIFSGATGTMIHPLPSHDAAVAGPGDLTGDGVPDAVVGSPLSAFGFDNVAAYSGATGAYLFGDNAGSFDWLGADVSGIGDVNADGVPDYAAGAPRNGAGQAFVRIYSGLDGSILRTLYGSGQDEFGIALAGAGDLNVDGFADLIIGEPGILGYYASPGTAYVFSGGDGSTLYTLFGAGDLHGLPVGQPGDMFGSSVAGIGDANGDGYEDLMVGAPLEDGKRDDAGAARVYSGRFGTLLYCFEGGGNYAQLGTAVSGTGDFDGDGLMDFAVGIPNAKSGTNVYGAVDIYSAVP